MEYKFLSSITIKSEYQLWPEWASFCQNAKGKSDLEIHIVSCKNYQNGIAVLDEQPGKNILRLNECLLGVDDDWTRAKVTSFDGNKFDVYKILNVLILTFVHPVIRNSPAIKIIFFSITSPTFI